MLGMMNPSPARPHDRDDGGLSGPKRNVDQESTNLAATDRFEVSTDRAYVPVVRER